MKIALIIDLWKPVTGGSQTHVQELSRKLIENYGCRVDIFTRVLVDDEGKNHNETEEQFMGKLRIIRVGPAAKLSSTWGRVTTLFSIAGKVYKEHKNQNYDFIHAHSILGGFIGKLASLLIHRPILFTVHGSPNMDGGRKNLDYFIEKHILTKLRYDRVISVGKRYTRYPNVNENISIIPNGVDIRRFEALTDSTKANFFKIIFVGRLDWVKGIETLIDAVKILKDEHHSLIKEKGVQFHLVGYGFEIDRYEKEVTRLKLDNLIFFRGQITGSELIREYRSSHLFILPSICEGQPITILEAMAGGLPVLTTCAADNSGIVTPEVGWRIEEKNSRLLAEKLLEAIQLQPGILEEMGKKGCKKVTRSFNWDIITEETYTLYSSLTDQGIIES
jgi:glycosyltransferase involved in cell wall biosynthesis